MKILHRNAWRCCGVLMSLSLFICHGVFADTKSTQPSNPYFGLVSKEKHTDTPAEKKAKLEKEAKKKASFQFFDPDPDDDKAPGEIKSMEGTISARNNYGMAVEYQSDAATGASKEMWMNFTSKLKLNGVKSLAEFQAGDMVRIIYKAVQDKDTKAFKKNILKGITLLNKKPKEESAAAQDLSPAAPAVSR